MIKYLFLLFSTFSFTIVNLFDLQDVSITHNIPEYLVSGKVYDVDIVINKGDIGGFAKFQMDVPDGINVKAVETRNSSFTFKSNVVKNIWMKVPEESEILLSYKFEVSPNFQGSGNIDARFVFIKDNERFTVEMPRKSVKVGDGSDIVATDGVPSGDAFSPEKLKLKRSIKAMGNNEFDVNIIIEKDGLEGFAKIQDVLPEGFEARPMRTSKSVFSIVENKVKFIWFNIPPEETIEISYILVSQYPVTDGVKLNGSFNYLFNDEARQLDFPEENLADYIDMTELGVAAQEEPVQEEPLQEEPLQKEPAQDDVEIVTTTTATAAIVSTDEEKVEEAAVPVEATAAEEIAVVEKEPENAKTTQEVEVAESEVIDEQTDTEVASIDVVEVDSKKETIVEDAIIPTSNIFYRVQLAAGKRNVNVSYIKKKHGFNSEIYLENHEGWYKYTTGSYLQYVEARNRREEIKQSYQFKGPFVTAYNSGERITVQEALLISKQKWVK